MPSSVDSLADSLAALGFRDAALSQTLTAAGVQDIAELAAMRDMDIRQTTRMNLADARTLGAAVKEEVQRRQEEAAAAAAAEAEARRSWEEAEVARLRSGLEDWALAQMLQENGGGASLLNEVAPVLMQEGLLTLADLDGLTARDFEVLGLSQAPQSSSPRARARAQPRAATPLLMMHARSAQKTAARLPIIVPAARKMKAKQEDARLTGARSEGVPLARKNPIAHAAVESAPLFNQTANDLLNVSSRPTRPRARASCLRTPCCAL